MRLKARRGAKAKADELDIWLYVASDSHSAADRLLDRLGDAVQMLAEFPEAGRARPDLAAGLRSYPMGQYVIFYTHDASTLHVVRIISSQRDVTSDLFG
jgi:toxin ParE1/3/4